MTTVTLSKQEKAYNLPTRQKALEILRKHPEGITPYEVTRLYGLYAWTTYLSDLRPFHTIEKTLVRIPGNPRANVYRYRLVEEVN